MKIQNDETTPLRIHKYVSKSKGLPYYMTFFNGSFRFVHDVARIPIERFKVCKNKYGKEYLSYVGEFAVARNGSIYIL